MGKKYVNTPPILHDIEEDLKKYLLCPESLPIHQYERNQEFWPRTADPKELLHFEGSPLCSTLKVQRDLNSGEIIEFKEVILQGAGATAMNSMSLNRDPAPPSEAVRGNASYIPFWPGSFPKPESDLLQPNLLDSELLTIPPGFKRGLVFDESGTTILNREGFGEKRMLNDPESLVNLLEIVQQEQEVLGVFETLNDKLLEHEKTQEDRMVLPEEEEVLADSAPVINISETPTELQQTVADTEWAILIDTRKPVTNFYERIPEMALNYTFELDPFQKLAILELEQHNHVFVSAHTSAGKTVVAEYAIALSQKHRTRTIYTSPIKALSNQKYRDFKLTFKDVGLITGDFQINQTASCLIMTTEILRSMLYCGSDITRDLEYVIFDEVHYVNDRERGHVWEQVLILLPAQVCVILLSATVPNALIFADWLGRTHQRKVYVVTTDKRPVPLQHFLYVGKGGAHKHSKHIILEADNWKREGYFETKRLMSGGDEKHSQGRNTMMSLKEEKTLWTSVINHLRKNELLPVVAFTFSRQKCDMNSTNLSNLDLTTQREKHFINMFFSKCIGCLKKPDQEIPQIRWMKDILSRGIGVHHSGVLPIVKEIVEMLFQKGLIKVLFATETFAMGVNMPARTVVFDSVRKHDGKQLRDLEPAEYIQMAGRAGRRGLDERGTVIILCKSDVPPEENLKKMMFGKPSSLVSQFRLTYGMVLSLLRVKSLTVEGMMSRSFREADHQKNLVNVKKLLKEVEAQLEELNQQQISSYLKPLVNFFKSANAYLEVRGRIMPDLLGSPKFQKFLVPGRILLITQRNNINKLALLLSIVKSKTLSYKVLVLMDSMGMKCVESNQEDLWYYMLGLASDNIFLPKAVPGHEVLTVTPLDIFEVSEKIIKLNTDLVIQDWEKRQIERFRNDPPGQTCLQAVQELQKLTIVANNNTTSNKLEFLHFVHDVKATDPNIYYNCLELHALKDKLIDHVMSTQIPNFEHHFSVVFSRKFLEEKLAKLKYQISDESLSLYPDFEKRIELLRKLDYVDMNNTVQVKGRVACEMGMNELLITELVLRDILTKLKPAEIAALLTALVFRVKSRTDTRDDEGPTEDLTKAIRDMKEIHEEIAGLERSLGIQTDEFQENLNFGLVYVVYEWASAKPFAEIMELTDVQEGIIVRCVQQLNEIICDIRNAARGKIGDPELQNKMEEASTAIKRDIIFAASLYTQTDGL